MKLMNTKHMIRFFTAALALTASLALVGTVGSARAEETAAEKVHEGLQDAGKGAKKAYRNMKDQVCEMVNGKMECVAKKAANKARNLKDEVKDKADDLKKKAD
jgi:hypothetical protein